MWKFCEKAEELRNNIHEGSGWPVAGSPISVAVRRVKSRSGKRPLFLIFTSKKNPSGFLLIVRLPISMWRRFQNEAFPAQLLVAFWASCVVYWGRDILWTRKCPLHRVPWWNSFWEVPNDVDCWDWLLVENPKALIVLGIKGSNRCRWVGLGNGHFPSPTNAKLSCQLAPGRYTPVTYQLTTFCRQYFVFCGK